MSMLTVRDRGVLVFIVHDIRGGLGVDVDVDCA